MRKLISIILSSVAFESFATGLAFFISKIQAQRSPDGYPTEPEWLMWGLLIALPTLTAFLAFWIWPEKEEEKIFYFYEGKSKNS